MRILTYNLWHGFAPATRLSFRRLEPSTRYKQRLETIVPTIESVHADILCLQEVNPVVKESARLAAHFDKVAFSQGDTVGVKAGDLGWPPSLKSGLALLLQRKWLPKLLGAMKLSGSKWSKESNWLNWQWAESRYAILSEILHPSYGRVLLINAHLHHGLELSDALKTRIGQLAEEGQLTASACLELKDRLGESNRRRENEITNLLEHIKQIESRYALVVLAGDFNFIPGSQAYQMVIEQGFNDSWLLSGQSEESGATFDSLRNRANHIFTQEFPLTVESEDLSFSPKTRQALNGILRDHERRPRRVDYIFLKSPNLLPKIKSAQLVGVPSDDEIVPSDHFGLAVELLE